MIFSSVLSVLGLRGTSSESVERLLVYASMQGCFFKLRGNLNTAACIHTNSSTR